MGGAHPGSFFLRYFFEAFGPWVLFFRWGRRIEHFCQGVWGVGMLFLDGYVLSRFVFSSGSACFSGLGGRSNWHYEIAFLVKVCL